MDDINETEVEEFILLAFSDFQQYEKFLFILVLLTYVFCIIGNISIIVLIRVQLSLHTPMYYFISIFAMLEMTFVSVSVPKLLANLIASNKKISFRGCFTQLYALNALGETECFLLAVMVFDRHLAIHNPLRYSAIMNHCTVTQLTVLPWVLGFAISFIPTFFTAHLEFCGPNKVDHFFCDLAPLQSLACSNPDTSKAMTSLAAVLATVLPFIIIMGFYIHIIYTVFNMQGSMSKRKSFSTCTSHLIVASLFYGTAITVYINPKGRQYEKFLALMYTVLTPLVNPFIYTLRNRDVKAAILKSCRQCVNNLQMSL
ncbi:putative olfactory receptor 2B8 [Spea bombifrons]|uniref:putative olfactory receptor 2B8 n=1 Tax=Spea bombifrons TaxID=233779 RepID=UPI00234BC258|nr:putative olfactory receptor 2B8 [Spea bombifrons]